MGEKTVAYKDIKDIFEARDRAIITKDKELLKSLYLNPSRVYIPRVTKFSTEIITVVDSHDEGIKKVSFVREASSYKDYGDCDEAFETDEKRYKIYHFINTVLGWKITQSW